MTNLEQYLHSLHIAEPQHYENLAVFPLIAPSRHAPSYITLDDALARGLFEVREVDEHGRVNEVMVLNKSQHMVLLVDGDILTGAKQNRIVNVSILVAAHATQNIPVSCVEQGRWRHVAEKFTSSSAFSYAHLRAKKSAQVSESLFARGDFSADQSAIWEEIRYQHKRMEVRPPTGALNDAYASQTQKMEALRSAFSAAEGQVGSIVFLQDNFICLDLFDSTETFHKLNKKMTESYALDALERTEIKTKAPPHENGVQLLAKAMAALAVAARYPSVGVGEDLRIKTKDFTGSCLTVDDKLIHFALFPSARKHNKRAPQDR